MEHRLRDVGIPYSLRSMLRPLAAGGAFLNGMGLNGMGLNGMR